MVGYSVDGTPIWNSLFISYFGFPISQRDEKAMPQKMGDTPDIETEMKP